jgi:hypothetical protein
LVANPTVLETAKEHFAKVVEEQLERVEQMKRAGPPTDFSKVKPIVIGMLGGDGIGPTITYESQRILEALLAELARIGKPGARIHVLVPYFSCVGAFGDPTHVRFFTYYTFDHFTEDPTRHTWFSGTRFRIARRKIGFGRLFRLLGVAWWANRWPHIYENFFAFTLPARTLEVDLIVPDPAANPDRSS